MKTPYRTCFAFFAFFCISQLVAENVLVDRSPWTGRVFEFEAKGIYEYEKSTKVSVKAGKKDHHTHAQRLAAALCFTPHPEWDLSLLALGCETERHDFAYDSTKIAAKHVLFNDLVSDPVSLALGAECSLQQRAFLKSVSVLHHGSFESLFYASLGKEFEYKKSHYLRTWIMGAFGVANKGSSWTRSEAHASFELSSAHTLDFFVDYECGNGNKKLRSWHHFPGYAHLAYYFADAAVLYRYQLKEFGSFIFEAKKRCAARYCPSNTTSLLIGLDIPFSF